MKDTVHKIYFAASQHMECLEDCSIDLIVTSPPYPMIEMWDNIMSQQNEEIRLALRVNPSCAFELMHKELDKVWHECYRLLKNGGLMCVNIGDATRTINGNFQLYNNHARIIESCLKLGFVNLPNIIWRKQTNAPNKFMGSGMLPCGAYVTLEHEWILVFRKGSKRSYKKEEDKKARRESSFFWEERNQWFSDLWEIKGVKQRMTNMGTRDRNASFPLEVPYRLINMYSQRDDVVLDPFFGLGTTAIAAMLTGRNSVGIEIDEEIRPAIEQNIDGVRINDMNQMIHERYLNHLAFVRSREAQNKEVKYDNPYLGCKVMTSQEVDMNLFYLSDLINSSDSPLTYICSYHNDIPVSALLSSDMNSLFFLQRS